MAFTPTNIGKRIEEAVEAELGVLGQEVVRDAVDYINTPKDGRVVAMDGTLANSMISETHNNAGLLDVVVGPTALHGLFRHEGTKPHWAPIEPLRYWVQKKLGIQGEAEINRVAYAVQAKIAKKGTEGTPFLAEPFNAYRGTVAGRVAGAIQAVTGG